MCHLILNTKSASMLSISHTSLQKVADEAKSNVLHPPPHLSPLSSSSVPSSNPPLPSPPTPHLFPSPALTYLTVSKLVVSTSPSDHAPPPPSNPHTGHVHVATPEERRGGMGCTFNRLKNQITVQYTYHGHSKQAVWLVWFRPDQFSP